MNWDQYFLSIAETVSQKSKDPSTKTGAVIVDEKHRPVSFGYNGFIANCDETKLTWDRPTKYFFSIHGEMNAILFAKQDLTNCAIYSLYVPCENCLKFILQSGITKIIYKHSAVESYTNKEKNSMTNDETKMASTRMLLSMPHVICKNINGSDYLDEMWGSKQNIPTF